MNLGSSEALCLGPCLEEEPPVLVPVPVLVEGALVLLADLAALVVDGPAVLVRQQLVHGGHALEAAGGILLGT